jgi:hypothetical protein
MRLHSIFAILLLTIPARAIPQTTPHHAQPSPKSAWKEYTYPEFGFAMIFPSSPKEEHWKDTAVYSVDLRDDVSVHVYAANKTTNCSDWEEWVKKNFDLKLSQKGTPKFPAASKAVVIDGHMAMEWESPTNPSHGIDYERRQCLNDRFYTFRARWPAGHPRPDDVKRILDSFRLLTKETKPPTQK